MPPVAPKGELTEAEVAIALLKGGLEWKEVVAVMERIKFDKSAWNGASIIKIYKLK